MPPRAAIFELHQLGEPRTGIWAPCCALPSGVEVDIAVVHSDTLAVCRNVVARGCLECGSQIE